MTAAKRRKPHTLQMVCSFVILFCFSVYGICLLVLADRTPWKVTVCVFGILYALAVQIIIHAGKNH